LDQTQSSHKSSHTVTQDPKRNACVTRYVTAYALLPFRFMLRTLPYAVAVPRPTLR